MGRKSLIKERKALTPKAETWVRSLFPLLQDRALEKITLDELASMMGKSKSTLYTYFETKNEIIEATVYFILNDIETAILKDFPDTEDMELAYRFMLLTISKSLSGLSIRFLDEIKEHYSNVWEMITKFIDRMLITFKNIYKKGMDSGQFNRFNIDLMMAMDMHFVVEILTDTTRFKNAKLSVNDLVHQYLELRIKALVKI
ncbi:TetR/AcrR family transcriptional regulator [Aquimarina sp. 2-A2]|uniref:TetR/AcrR family transcriptional regulator n=1 Tax=Aquimarina sp. 2-A2 TaxID=3382644 RepID=UPI00387EFD0A